MSKTKTKKTREGIRTLKLVKRWLKNETNTRAKLAYLLGYESSVTINNWERRGYVPVNAVAMVQVAIALHERAVNA